MLSSKRVAPRGYTHFGKKTGEPVPGFGYKPDFSFSAAGAVYFMVRNYEPP